MLHSCQCNEHFYDNNWLVVIHKQSLHFFTFLNLMTWSTCSFHLWSYSKALHSSFNFCPNYRALPTFNKIALPLTPLSAVKLHRRILRNASFAAIALPTLLPLNWESVIVTWAPSKTWIRESLLEWFKNIPCLILRWHSDSIVIAEPLVFELNSVSIMVMPSSFEWQLEMWTKGAFVVQLVKAMCDMVTPGDL